MVTETSEAPSPAKQSKACKVVKKRTKKSSLQLVDEFVDKGVPENEPRIGDEEADLQKAVEESLKEFHSARQGPLPPVVIREPESGKLQPLPEVQGKGKEKVGDEQVALDLLNLQTPKKKILADQYIFQRLTSTQTEPTGHDESSLSPPIYNLTCEHDEGQAGPNPGDAEASQPPSSHVVHTRPNLEHMDLEASDTLIQPNPEQMDEEFTTTAYPNVQENLKLPTEGEVRLEEPASSAGTLSSLQNLDKELSFADQFLVEKSQEDEPEKTNTESEVQSMVTVPIHQDTSSVPLMTTPVIDLTVSQPVPTAVQAPLPTLTATATATTTTTTTTLPPIPPQPQQGSSDLILIQRIGELEQHMADMVEANQALEERLDKQGSRLYKLENLNIPHQVSKAVDEIVTDDVDWAIQAPLRDRFRDFPEADMKDILHHRMWESNSYQAHEDHKLLYEALEKSMAHNHTDQLLTDLAKVRRKKKKRRDSPKTPLGSPPHQPPHPPPPPGSYGTPGASGASDIVHDHIPTVNLRQYWWKTLTKDRPATPEPAWSIPSSDLPVPVNNWASALASTYAPPPENSLLAQTGDMAIFIDWFYKKQGITELKQQVLEGPAYEIVKVFHPNVIHLQYQMEECHKLLTDQVDESIIRYNVNKPLPLGGPPSQVMIQSDFFFNKDLEYLRYSCKSGRPALSISKMKEAYYPNVGLEQMVPDQMWIEEECKYDIASIAVRNHMRILTVVRIEVFSLYGYDYMKKIVLRRADLKEYTIALKDFKYITLVNFEVVLIESSGT
ncbi:retrovirus-related pol polyprotein from transposon TNT 1-94 [Tanacetum coccineum]|uniref:Retrovirus-related pol polyprotein from transposon TNT 1-94 n=1 Tax=Tanacetum coccineum TaxID=301880 RepID=A0ABQ5IAT1_9ASTR